MENLGLQFAFRVLHAVGRARYQQMGRKTESLSEIDIASNEMDMSGEDIYKRGRCFWAGEKAMRSWQSAFQQSESNERTMHGNFLGVIIIYIGRKRLAFDW